jgi:hypothetical protein
MSGRESDAEPPKFPPPWIQTITGTFEAEGLGVQTLRYRQSSVVLADVMFVELAFCGHRLPNCDASRTLVHGVGGCGPFQRRPPTGGAA